MPHIPRLRVALALCLVPAVLVACQAATKPEAEPMTAPAPEDESEAQPRRDLDYELVEGEPMYNVLPLDGIPAIDAPEFLTAAEGERFMQPDEPVLGVVGPDGTAKAYSAWQLEGHEIVNDEIDGMAIAATW